MPSLPRATIGSIRRRLAPLKHAVTMSLPVLRRHARRHGVRDPATDYSLAVPFGYRPRPATRRVAIVAQIFYPELSGEMLERLRAVPAPADIYLTVPSDSARETVAAAFAAWDRGSVTIKVVANRGRDVPTKLIHFRDVLDRYDLLLMLHAKRSVGMEAGNDWRDTILDGLVGSDETVASILALFDADPSLGIVAPQHYDPMRRWLGWAGCDAAIRRHVAAMGGALKEGGPLDFVSGTMFWARPSALKPLLSLGLKIEDFEPEPTPPGATLAHAVERMLLLSAEIAGFGWLKVAAPAHYRHQRQILRVGSPADLPAAMEKAAFRLL